MIDTHCHLTFRELHEQLDTVLANAADAGVDRMITVGILPDDTRLAIEVAHRFDNVFATAGIHPHYADRFADSHAVIETLRELSCASQVVAIGEMGLDKHYPDPPIEQQVRLLEWQLEAAADLDLPVIIHNRKATEQMIEILNASDVAPERCIFHCFTGTAEELDAILTFGASVGFTGITTFKNAADIADCAVRTPIGRLLLETDSPYLAPEPHRKVRPNQPCYVRDVARFIAARRGMSEQDLTDQTDANACGLFRLPEVR